MKKPKLLIWVAMGIFVFASCAGPSEKRAEILEQLEAGELPEEVNIYNVDADASRVAWEGRQVRGTHDGTIDVHSGELYVYEGELLGGKVIMDMQQIVVLDIEDPEMNARLNGHLKSDDFFSVETYPTAEFEITSVEPLEQVTEEANHRVYGNMTIKGITHGIAIDAMIRVEDNFINAYADFDLDRSRWDVRFRSARFFENLGDNLIYDDFNLKMNIVANK
jgi:polyisoprenoid-binding protein YceI